MSFPQSPSINLLKWKAFIPLNHSTLTLILTIYRLNWITIIQGDWIDLEDPKKSKSISHFSEWRRRIGKWRCIVSTPWSLTTTANSPLLLPSTRLNSILPSHFYFYLFYLSFLVFYYYYYYYYYYCHFYLSGLFLISGIWRFFIFFLFFSSFVMSGLIAETQHYIPYPLNCFIYLSQYLMFDCWRCMLQLVVSIFFLGHVVYVENFIRFAYLWCNHKFGCISLCNERFVSVWHSLHPLTDLCKYLVLFFSCILQIVIAFNFLD